MLLSLTNNVARLFFIFALFPFVSFGTNSMDSQPHYIFLAFLTFILFTFSGLVFRKALHLIIILMIILLTLFLSTNHIDFVFIRGVASYSAFFITLIVSIIYYKKYGIPTKIIVGANIVYILAGLMQKFIGPHVLNFLVVPNSFPDPSRGVISLTPEPTFFGIVLFFFGMISFIMYDYKPTFKITLLIIANFLSIIFLAKSSMVIVFLLVSVFIYLLRNYKSKRIIIQSTYAIILILILTYIFSHIYPESRILNLGSMIFNLDGGLFDRLSAVIFWDASVNDRLLNVIFPYYGFVFNYALPGGLSSYYEMSIILSNYFDGYFWAGLGSNKILSFVGSFIYELGIVGFLFFIYIYSFLRDKSNPNRAYELLLLFILLHSAIAIAFSIIPILLAIMYHLKVTGQNYIEVKK